MAAIGAGPAASAADMPALVGALERLVEAYIELAMVGVDTLWLACVWLRPAFFVSGCIAPPALRWVVEGEEEEGACAAGLGKQ